MATKTPSEEEQKLHAAAMASFDRIQTAVAEERRQCLADRRFYSIAGAMWEGAIGDQFENKPQIEVNLIHLAIIRIITEYRANRIDVSFIAKDGSADNQLADACASLYRTSEQDSVAEEAHDNAFEEAVGGGFGAWRLRADKEDEEDEEDDKQTIKIEPIVDADTCVFFDLGAKRQDKSDAKECFVITSMTREAFKEEWGDDPSSWPKDIEEKVYDWAPADTVNVAEYYKVEMRNETVFTYTGLDGAKRKVTQEELDDDESTVLEELQSTGYRVTGSKKLNVKRIHKYILSGRAVLEDCGLIAGKNIPIVPVYGKRWYVDGIERCMGHVRLARDTQMMKNMQVSKLAELAAMSSAEKPIFCPEQVSGHQTMWTDDNVKNYPYLLINSMIDANGTPVITGPAAYTHAPTIPPAMAALLQLTDVDMQNILGNQQQGEKIQSNVSGDAIELVQMQLGINTAIYVSNFSKAIRRSGQIWLSMARELFVEEGRYMRGVTQSGDSEQIQLYKTSVDDNGVPKVENAMSDASFSVKVTVGPSSASKKQSTVRALTGVAGVVQDPESSQVITSMIMMNMEGEGVQDARDFFRKRLVKMGVVKPTKEELLEMQKEADAASQQQDPQAEFLAASAQQAQALAQKAQADTMLAAAKAELTKAQTVETLANMDIAERKQAIEAAEAMSRGLETSK